MTRDVILFNIDRYARSQQLVTYNFSKDKFLGIKMSDVKECDVFEAL